MNRAATPPERNDEVEASPDEETRKLRSQLRDLVAVLTLPTMWRGRGPDQIVSSLADLLVHLMRLDVVYVRLDQPESDCASEELRPINLQPAAAIMASIRAALGSESMGSIPDANGQTIRLARGIPGIDTDEWFLAVGSRRPDFPTAAEGFLLGVTVEQAAVSVENARLYRQAKAASKAKSDFIATTSHELRTPLNAILGYSELLLLGVPEPIPQPSTQHVGRIRASAHHLLHLIDEILSFSRLEAGVEEVHVESVDLEEITTETAELVRPLADEKGLAFHCRAPDSPMTIVTDPGKVRQILLNLLSNAIKFTDAGTVEIEAEAADAGVSFRVRDTGIGIPLDQAERIFEPFRQIDQSSTRKAGGTGLGLSVSRQLARLLGGELTVISRPEEGSTFILQLPGTTGAS